MGSPAFGRFRLVALLQNEFKSALLDVLKEAAASYSAKDVNVRRKASAKSKRSAIVADHKPGAPTEDDVNVEVPTSPLPHHGAVKERIKASYQPLWKTMYLQDGVIVTVHEAKGLISNHRDHKCSPWLRGKVTLHSGTAELHTSAIDDTTQPCWDEDLFLSVFRHVSPHCR